MPVVLQLTDALAREDNESLKRLVDVFGRLGRIPFLVRAFSSSRVKPLRDCWAEALDAVTPVPELFGT